ncbi:MAG: hypothetical protein KGH59_04595, partial [Candidatus Micrarchaeota archaeon]|nr:hypothetical protein [Candidatus Micrarchaeota archaeon]
MGLFAQSATEFLLTYGWAFLIIAVVLAALYFFVVAPGNITPGSCQFSSGANCQDIIMGSSSQLTKIAVLLSNTQSYPIASPRLIFNATQFGSLVARCVPNLVLPGGAIICNATIKQNNIAAGALVAGSFQLNYLPCPSGNASNCQSSTGRTNFAGSFNVHSSPLLSPLPISITLAAQNATQIANGQKDKLTANLKLLGTPVTGATLNFTSNKNFVSISPFETTTDS